MTVDTKYGSSWGASVTRAVVAFDELGDGGTHVGEMSKDPAVNGLLLERAIPALDDPVGFRLFEEAEAGVDAPVAELVEEVVRQILAEGPQFSWTWINGTASLVHVLGEFPT